MHKSNTQVVYLDETVFTFSTFRSNGWAHNRERIRIDDSNLRVTTLAAIAAISEEAGLEDVIICPRAINAYHFVELLNELRAKSGEQYLVLFLDSLQVHKTEEVKAAYDRLNFSLCLTCLTARTSIASRAISH